MNSTKRKLTQVVLSIVMAFAFLAATFLLIPNDKAVADPAELTWVDAKEKGYTVQAKDITQTASKNGLFYFGNSTGVSTEVGTTMYLTYKVQSKTTDLTTQHGVVATTQIDGAPDNRPFNATGSNMYSGGNVLLDVGYTYQFIYFRDSATTWQSKVTKIDKDGVATTVELPSVTSSTIGEGVEKFGVWYHADVANCLAGLYLSNVQCYDNSGNDLGVAFIGIRSSAFSITDYIPPLEWMEAPATISNKMAIQQKSERSGLLFFGNSTEISGVNKTVYLTYKVQAYNKNDSTRYGIVANSSTDANYAYSGGRMEYTDGTKYLLSEIGCTYQFAFDRTGDTTWRYLVTKIDKDGNSTPITFAAGTGSLTAGSGYYGVWFDTGAYDGLVLTNVKCYDQDGNDLGIKFNTCRNDFFTYAEYVAPLEWVEKDVPAYRVTDYTGSNVSGLYISNKTALTTVGSTVFMTYQVIGSVESSQNGIVIAKEAAPDQAYIYSSGNGEMFFDVPSNLKKVAEEGYTYQVIIERDSETSVRYSVNKTNESGTTALTFSQDHPNTITADKGYYGVWFAPATGIAINGLQIENVKIYDQDGNDLGVSVNNSNAIVSNAPTGDVTITYTDANGDEIVGLTQTVPYLTKITVADATAYGYTIWGDTIKGYLSGSELVVGEDMILQGVAFEMKYGGAYVRSAAPYGLRFRNLISYTEYEALKEAVGEANVTIGTIILPTDYLTAKGITADGFTLENLDALGVKYANAINNGFNGTVSEGGENYYAHYAALVNILDANLTREFSARAYVTINLGGQSATFYGEYDAANQSRSIYSVASKAIEAGVTGEKLEVVTSFVNEVANVTVSGSEASLVAINGYANPYTVAISGNVVTISGASVADIKVILINGVAYAPVASGDTVTATIKA